MEIIAGILETDVKELERKATLAVAHVDALQIDIGDNTIFPCKTVHDIALLAPAVERLVKAGTKMEAHLMVAKPDEYLAALAEAGFTRVVAHVECHDPREFLAEARTHEFEVGLAIDVDTEFEALEPFLEEVDFVLVMTVEAGASGNMFEEAAVEKIKTIHRNLPDVPIEVDGGMTPDTVKMVTEAGATRIVSTSYLFKNEQDIASAVDALKSAQQG